MEQKTGILHVMWSGGIGGAEEYVSSLARFFDPEKYSMDVCILSEKGELFEEISKNEKVGVYFIGIRNGKDIAGALKFITFLKSKKYDIVHLHTRNILTTLLLFLFAGKKAMLISHHTGLQKTDLNDIKMQKKARMFYKVFSGCFRNILAISHAVKDSLIHNTGISDPDKIEVVHNGVDMNKFSKLEKGPEDLQNIPGSDRKIVGFVGRMVPFKRPELFVRIALELLSRDKRYFFVMAGDGPELSMCRALIEKHDAADYFRILGFRRDVPGILQILDALLFTSEGEGFGIVLIEAMAMGRPVFAVYEGAVAEIIRHRENGILLDTLDTGRIALQVDDALEDDELIGKIKERSIRDVKEHFSVERSIRQMESIYKNIMGEGI